MPHWNSIDLSDIRYKKVNTSKMSDKLDNNEVAKKENNYDCMIRIEVKRCAKLVCWNSYLFLLCDAYNKRKQLRNASDTERNFVMGLVSQRNVISSI